MNACLRKAIERGALTKRKMVAGEDCSSWRRSSPSNEDALRLERDGVCSGRRLNSHGTAVLELRRRY